MIKNNKKGMAVVVVLFFAFAIAIIMFFMLQSNSNLTNQTKQTLYEMQANYLAQSAMQYGKLQIYLLPKEIYEYYSSNSGASDCFDKCDSDYLPPLAMSAFYDPKSKYDLFENDKAPDLAFPYGGKFAITKCEYILSNANMKMVQDSYRLEVEASIAHGQKKEKSDTLSEDFIVSRYTGR